MKKTRTAILAAFVIAATPVAAANGVRAISASEKAQGAQAHPQLLQEFGGAYDGPQSAYVERVGRRIALQSGLANSEKDFTVTLLNSPVNNAFAIPGGYVYVTRQLLALMNDEAELAAVLGHEVGHVAARHAAKRNSTSTIGSILAAGVGVLTGRSELGQLAGYGAQLYTLRFSRTQEYQADDLGIRYLKTAGYDATAAADILASLNAINEVDARVAGRTDQGVPTWASTHPNTADRVRRARAQATGSVATQRNRDTFLAAIDGMLYDDDPRQGIIDGQTFRHGELRFAFTAPQGHAITNGQTAVTISGSGGQARFQGGALGSGGLEDYVDKAFQAMGNGQSRVNYSTPRTTRVNGMDMMSASARASTQSGQVDVTVSAFRFNNALAYHFLTITPQGSGVGVFRPLIDSFRKLNDQEVAAIKPRRLRVVTVRQGDTLTGLANRMAYTDYRMERFLALNALPANATVQPGQKIKLVLRD